VSADLESPTFDAGDRTALHVLVDEAARQLTICNSCRYCEGLCAVYPALERRDVLSGGDISQLANLCHDCRACYDACMYSPPHAFKINVPRILSEVRVADYRRYAWPANPPRLLRGWWGVFSGAAAATALVFVVAVLHVGGLAGLISADRDQSPYRLIPYPELLALLLVPAVFTVAVMTVAGIRFWRATSTASDSTHGILRATGRAVLDGLTLKNLRGGGGDCYYPKTDKPSSSRRRLHMAVVAGFGLCLVSTISAAVMQDMMGLEPPYELLSVPVVCGTLGGIGLVVGCAGLLHIKVRSANVVSVAEMTIKDYGLLCALTFLALSGLATLVARSSPAFGPTFLVHLAAIILTFAAMPYSKLVHVVYRSLALVRDHAELARAK
jgi:citrate/tricarballylate utilization protein